MHLYPDQVKPRLYPTVANPSGENHLDRLVGIKDAFLQLKNGFEPEVNIDEQWAGKIGPWLMY
jgi:hypothetical protein